MYLVSTRILLWLQEARGDLAGRDGVTGCGVCHVGLELESVWTLLVYDWIPKYERCFGGVARVQ